MNERKAGLIKGYIFLEKNNYTGFSMEIIGNNGIVFNDIKLSLSKIKNNGYEDIVRIEGNDVKDFIIEYSGFYMFVSRFILYNRWKVDNLNDINFNLKCKKGTEKKEINLKDYMYKGQLYPDSYDQSDVSKEFKINKCNLEIIKDLKFEDNDATSLTTFKNYIDNDLNDYFNIKYWNKIIDKCIDLRNAKVLLDENCTDNTSNCILLKTIANMINKIKPYIDNDNKINLLFSDVIFKPPTLKLNVNITNEFTNIEQNIEKYITYEKESNSIDRTQKNINGDYFNYFDLNMRNNAMKSIYLKKN